MSISAENLQNQIPYYLTDNQKMGLQKALADFMSNKNICYYLSKYENEMLQGDGWSGFQIIHFKDLKRKSTKGILLSNSCDISPKNFRDLPVKINFVPIINLNAYKQILINNGVSEASIDAKITNIKQQKTTSIFYLPQGSGLEADHIALLDDIHTIPMEHLRENESSEKIFTLSMVGFYLFLFKLSVHFCRFHEEIER